jgi:muramidase (phage lysozyme)
MRAVLFVAVIALALTAVAGTAVAASSDADHLGTEKLDKLHPERPIAASPTPTAYSVAGTAVRGTRVRASSSGRSLQLFSDALGFESYYKDLTSFVEAKQAQAALDAYLTAVNAVNGYLSAVAAANAPRPAVFVSSGYSGGSFLDCVRAHESGGNYTVHNTQGSGASGAYQFMPGTWNSIAAASGRPDLVGIDPASASPADQDAMATALYAQQGGSPWAGDGC